MSTATNHLKSDTIYTSLGSNERAIVDRIQAPRIRRLLIRIVGIKMGLQFTGWLQYLIPLPVTLVLFLLTGLVYLAGLPSVAAVLVWLPLALSAVMLFDIVTCRLRVRLPEALPKSRSCDDVFTLMRSRRSCRSYQTRNLKPEHEQALQASIAEHLSEPRLGPAPIRLEWVSAPITVWPVVNAGQFLVAIAPAEYDRTAILDIGRTLQKIVLDATRMGLGTCWIGPGADHQSVKAHLGERFDENSDAIICLCAVGYPSWYSPLFVRAFSARFHQRLPLPELFFADGAMTRPLAIDAEPWAAFGRSFESCQWGPSSYNGQTTRAVGTQTDRGPRLDFCAVTSSRYYAAVATGIWCANWELGCDALGIDGHFRQLTGDERAVAAPDETLPRYEISWVTTDDETSGMG